MTSASRHPFAEAIEAILREDHPRPLEIDEGEKELALDVWLHEEELQALENYHASRVSRDSGERSD